MATQPTLHSLSHTSVHIRPTPTGLPLQPGDVCSGHVALVAVNDEGVRDVKHRLDLGGLEVKYFWEARIDDAPEPAFIRGGTTVLLLVGGEGEQVLLMPAAGQAGSNVFEACWEFSFTIPEKPSVDHQSPSLISPSSSTGKARAYPFPTLSGPPPSFHSSKRSISHFLEAHLSFAGAGPESARETLDARGYRIASGELDVVERVELEVAKAGYELGEEAEKGWETVLPASGLNIQVKLSHVPIQASLAEPLALEVFLHLPPAAAAPPTPEKKKTSLLSSLTGGKGKEKRREEEAVAASSPSTSSDATPFIVERFGGHIEIVTTGSESVIVPLVDEEVNIASLHPVLSTGLSSEIDLDFAHALNPSDAKTGPFSVPGVIDRQFLLSLWVKTSLKAEPQPLITRAPMPVVPVFTPQAAPAGHAGGVPGGWDYGAPPEGPPPPEDEPPTWGATMGEGASGSSGQRAPADDGPPPPGYM